MAADLPFQSVVASVANVYRGLARRARMRLRQMGLMNLMLAGLSHKTASVEVRERFAISERRIPEALATLRAEPEIQEALILSTCNRVEFVVKVREDYNGLEALPRFAGSFYGPAYNEHAPFFYVYCDYEALRHLFRVASGLDSMVVGEPQVLGQVSRRSGWFPLSSPCGGAWRRFAGTKWRARETCSGR